MGRRNRLCGSRTFDRNYDGHTLEPLDDARRRRYCRILFNGCGPATPPYRPMWSTRIGGPRPRFMFSGFAPWQTTGSHATTVAARSLTPAARCRLPGPHPPSTDIGAPTPSRRVGARNPNTNSHESPFWGSSMDFVDRGDDRPEPISIARCRELLGDEADTLTDQDIEMICRYAETMAQI